MNNPLSEKEQLKANKKVEDKYQDLVTSFSGSVIQLKMVPVNQDQPLKCLTGYMIGIQES